MTYWDKLGKFTQPELREAVLEDSWRSLIRAGALSQACRSAVEDEDSELLERAHETVRESSERIEQFARFFYETQRHYHDYGRTFGVTARELALERIPEVLNIAVLGARVALAAQRQDVTGLQQLVVEAGSSKTGTWFGQSLAPHDLIEQFLAPTGFTGADDHLARIRQSAHHALGSSRLVQLEVKLPLLSLTPANSAPETADDSGVTGWVYWLHLRRLANGSGICFDDPPKMGLLPIGRDFLESVATAWKVACRLCDTANDVDICWWISDIAELNPGLVRPLHGTSVGALFSVALTQFRRGRVLDDDWAITAAVDERGHLHPVEGVQAKLQQAFTLNASSINPRINRIIVHPENAAAARQAARPESKIITTTSVEETLPQVELLAQDIRAFLANLWEKGLLTSVRERPAHLITGSDIEAFCVPPRVIDLDKNKEEQERHRRGREPRHSGSERHEEMSVAEWSLRDDTNSIRPQSLPIPQGRNVVIGDPGGGKTTALWLTVAQQCKDPDSGLPHFRVPLVLPLAHVDAGNKATLLTDQALEFVIRLSDSTSARFRNWLTGKIKRGEYTLYLDAFDELPGAEPDQSWLRQQLDSLPASVPILITTRASSSSQIKLRQPRRYELSPFGPRQIRQFVERYFSEKPNLATELLERHRLSSGTRQFMQLPFLLGLLCDVKAGDPNEPLPRSRTELLKRALDNMFQRGDEKRAVRSSRRRRQQKERVLRHIAWRFHAREPQPMSGDDLLDELLEHRELVTTDPPANDEALLAELLEDGVLVRTGRDRFSFVLRSFHEYCLAGWIACESPFHDDEDQFLKALRGDSRTWGRSVGITSSRSWNQVGPTFGRWWSVEWKGAGIGFYDTSTTISTFSSRST